MTVGTRYQVNSYYSDFYSRDGGRHNDFKLIWVSGLGEKVSYLPIKK